MSPSTSRSRGAYLTDDYQGEVPAIKAVIIENTLPSAPAPVGTAE